MTALLPYPDPDGLLEYSVVYTDRAVNHMSQQFQTTMRDLSRILKGMYGADGIAIIPGSGTSGMEAVARQLAKDKRCLILRNGFFSYRWSQILEKGNICAEQKVLTAKRQGSDSQAPFAPMPIDEACTAIAEYRPEIVFAPHVETASGIILNEEYIAKLAKASHDVGALLVIDCIASGCIWLDMKQLGIDLLLTAPQKGLSSTPCCGIVLFNNKANEAINQSESDSFDLDLKKWRDIMQAFETGGHAYHATMPTDGLIQLRDTLEEAQQIGLDKLKAAQSELGQAARNLLAQYGFPSVASAEHQAPGVIVAYTTRPDIQNGKAFAAQGLQIAAGVPLQCNEGDDFQTFRIGLFGFDKLTHVGRTIDNLEISLKSIKP